MTPVSEKKPPEVSDSLHFGGSSNRYGSPQAEFEIPYGTIGQNGPYARVATLYGATYGYNERAIAKIAVDQRVNANHHPGATFHDVSITVEDVVNSPVIASPLHMLEIVMPVMGGAGVLVTNADLARRSRNRPVWVKGFGERVNCKMVMYAENLLQTPMIKAAQSAFSMSGTTPADLFLAALVIVGTAASSIAASFGISVLIWQGLIGMPMHWIVLLMSVIILLAVGSDYNLLLVSRFKRRDPRRNQDRRHPLDGRHSSMAGTGGIVTSAGLVFAATMAGMVGSKLTTLAQMGSTIAIGLLVDTLIVRSLLMPSIAVLLGRWFWWPQVVYPRGDNHFRTTLGLTRSPRSCSPS